MENEELELEFLDGMMEPYKGNSPTQDIYGDFYLRQICGKALHIFSMTYTGQHNIAGTRYKKWGFAIFLHPPYCYGINHEGRQEIGMMSLTFPKHGRYCYQGQGVKPIDFPESVLFTFYQTKKGGYAVALNPSPWILFATYRNPGLVRMEEAMGYLLKRTCKWMEKHLSL